MSRRSARRAALTILYQWDLAGQPSAPSYPQDADEFTRTLVEGVTDRADELDGKITAATVDWTADRLGVLERNILRLGIHELERGELPVEVAIDEAVELAKRYTSDEAARLVNGVLGRLAREAA